MPERGDWSTYRSVDVAGRITRAAEQDLPQWTRLVTSLNPARLSEESGLRWT
jgi:hypothetical protein